MTLASEINDQLALGWGLFHLGNASLAHDEVIKAHNVKPPEIPVIFNKQTTSANGPYADIDLPAESAQLDYEAELGVVIGKTCRRVSVEQALEVVAGYTVLNDVTIRDWQLATATMTMGKSWDTHCPMGPVIVTTDEISV